MSYRVQQLLFEGPKIASTPAALTKLQKGLSLPSSGQVAPWLLFPSYIYPFLSLCFCLPFIPPSVQKSSLFPPFSVVFPYLSSTYKNLHSSVFLLLRIRAIRCTMDRRLPCSSVPGLWSSFRYSASPPPLSSLWFCALCWLRARSACWSLS